MWVGIFLTISLSETGKVRYTEVQLLARIHAARTVEPEYKHRQSRSPMFALRLLTDHCCLVMVYCGEPAACNPSSSAFFFLNIFPEAIGPD